MALTLLDEGVFALKKGATAIQGLARLANHHAGGVGHAAHDGHGWAMIGVDAIRVD